MPSDPPEDEGLKTVRRDGPAPHILHGDLAQPGGELVIGPRRSSTISMLTFAGAVIIFILAAVWGWLYFAAGKSDHRQAAIEPVAAKESPPPPSATPPAWASKNVVPVFPEMLKVSSIAMGKTPLVIVNGQRLAPGDWLDVKTERGVATLVVEKIEDGAVHFRNGDMTIDAKMAPRSKPMP
jgi:hypothetical protein